MKYISRSFIVILILSLLFGMSACQQAEQEQKYVPESAIVLWNKVDEAMSAMQSMEMRSTVDAIFYNGGDEFRLAGSSYIFSSKQTHYTKTNTTVSCNSISFIKNTSMMEAHHDGKMYIASDDGTYSQKLCSAMTHEEYDHIQTGVLTDDLDLADCTSAQFSQNEDDTWTLQFSGYTKKTIDKMVESFSMTPDMLAVPIADVKVSLSANAQFLVQKMEFSFDFAVEDEEMTPTFRITAEYSNYDTAVFDTAKLNTEEFTEVDDVRILESLQTLLQERQNTVSGKFTMDLKSTYQLQDQITASQEQATFTYGRKNGAYFYSGIANIDRKTFAVSYGNGQQEVTVSGQTSTAFQSEEEAKAYIDGLINMANYTPTAITGIQKLDEGVYLLLGQPKNLEQTIGITGIDEVSANQECKVTFESNKLMKIENKLVVAGKYTDQPVTLTVESVVTFEDEQ